MGRNKPNSLFDGECTEVMCLVPGRARDAEIIYDGILVVVPG
jgi:hypothetical protein